jgi:hypothetical protein
MIAPYVKSRPDDSRISSHHTATIMAPDTMAAFDDNPEMHHGSESGSLHATGCAKKTVYLPQILHISIDARNKLV